MEVINLFKQKELKITLFVGLILAGCGGNSTTPSSQGTTSVNNSTTSQGPAPITLSYADWANPEFNQRMIDLFQAKYPHITVQLRQDILGSGAEFTGNLIAASQAGLLPDVFATDNVPTVVNAGLTLDVAQYWDADQDAALVYENIKNTGIYNNKRFAIPSFQFLKGVLINLDIFKKADLQTTANYRIDGDGYPVKDWTFEEMINIAKAIKNFDLQDYQNLVVGLDTWYGTPDFQQVWPTMENEATQYDTWDGTKFSYTSPEWKSAMQAKVDLHRLTDGTTTRFNQEDIDAHAPLKTYMIRTGYAAMDIEGSWQFWVIKDAIDNLNFELGFWPYPSGSKGLFPPTILDFQAISANTRHPEAAYLLAKWMTYGREGWNARLDLLEADRQAALNQGKTPDFLDRFPVAEYAEIWDRVDGLVEGIQGIDAIFDRIEFAKPDLDKWLPGYKEFWGVIYDQLDYPYRWENLVTQGSQAVNTFAEQWNTLINDMVTSALENLGKPPTTQ
jgi:multiple sugar transport system substrate-binding protein